MPFPIRQATVLSSLFCCVVLTFAQTQPAPAAPKAAQGYSVNVFARGVAGQYTAPDSIAVDNGHVFVGFGDGHKPDGSDGKNTQIVQYSLAGTIEWIYNVKGHNDGLKVDPYQHYVWALQNEDATPNAVAINYTTHQQSQFTFAAAPSHGGGYDDIVFRAGKVYLSASNPANDPNTGPAIVEATVSGTSISVTPVLNGNAQATNVLTGAQTTLNLQDPDSMTLDPSGDLFLTSQADGTLIVVRQPSTKSQSVLQIPLSSPYGTPQVDDTLFTPAADGFILVADKNSNTVYAIHKTVFAPGAAYSSAQTGTGGTAQAFIGKLDTDFGQLTPVVTGLTSSGGMAFVNTQQTSTLQQVLDFCNAISAFTGSPLN
jgi:hypothetical protein